MPVLDSADADENFLQELPGHGWDASDLILSQFMVRGPSPDMDGDILMVDATGTFTPEGAEGALASTPAAEDDMTLPSELLAAFPSTATDEVLSGQDLLTEITSTAAPAVTCADAPPTSSKRASVATAATTASSSAAAEERAPAGTSPGTRASSLTLSDTDALGEADELVDYDPE